MTRKDYEAVAQSLNLAKRTLEEFANFYDAQTALALTARILAERFEKDNENFDGRKFLLAWNEVSA